MTSWIASGRRRSPGCRRIQKRGDLMDDREREELFDNLVSAIGDAGLGRVSGEVAELIAQGAEEPTPSSQAAGQEALKPSEYRS